MSPISRPLLKQIISEQRTDLLNKTIGIPREILSEVQKKNELPHIVFITGVRRCGKSTLLRQIIREIYHDDNFYYINFEDERFFQFDASEFNGIYEVLVELHGEHKVFLVDEIQNIDRFETFVRRFYDKGFKFYITGSSANLLQSEMATKLTGRYVSIVVKPFSFIEYLRLQNVDFQTIDLYRTERRAVLKHHFDIYLENGGMPEYIIFQEAEILFRIYQDLLFKDIVVRYGAIDIWKLRELAQYLVSNVAKKFSYNALKSLLRTKSVTTIKNYIDYITDTCFGIVVAKFDRSIKRQLISEKKFYVVDNGFIRKISSSGTLDLTYKFENLVLTALWGRGSLFYHSRNHECDFVLLRENVVQALYQVCFQLSQSNRKREIAGLIDAAQDLQMQEGWIITYDQEEELEEEGIKIHVVPAWIWFVQNRIMV